MKPKYKEHDSNLLFLAYRVTITKVSSFGYEPHYGFLYQLQSDWEQNKGNFGSGWIPCKMFDSVARTDLSR